MIFSQSGMMPGTTWQIQVQPKPRKGAPKITRDAPFHVACTIDELQNATKGAAQTYKEYVKHYPDYNVRLVKISAIVVLEGE
jgi:hypothetical protein